MEYLKKDELYKNRSYAKCISCGYHALVNNYKNIFSYTWKSALAFCLVVIIALSITDSFSIPSDVTGWIVWSVMAIAVILSQYYLIAHIVNIFTEQGKLTVFKKLLVMVGWAVCAKIVIAVVLYLTLAFSYQSQYNKEIFLSVFSLITILALVLGIPFGYLCIKYVVSNEKHFFNVVKSNFSKGFSHWGLIFVTLILSWFFVAAASFIVALPFYILIVAKILSVSGVSLGDESGMPGYFPILFSITSAIVLVLIMYFNTFIFSTLYYTYGSIEQRENERIGFMQNSMKD